MKIYTLKAVQKFPVPSDEIWKFISDPKNLASITPTEMNFRTLSGDEREMFAGQIIHYRLTPVMGIKMQWVTEITHVEPKKFFVDEQRFGPYAFWHHKHFLKEIPGGTEMEDIVHYKLPLPVIGSLLHPIFVKPRLDGIFEFRKKRLIELFGEI